MILDYAAQIKKAISDIQALKTLVKTVDPASGMSVCVRRGVLSDRVEDEDNRARREWVSTEICQHMGEILGLLIEARYASLRMWCKRGLAYATDVINAEAQAQEMLKDPSKLRD